MRLWITLLVIILVVAGYFSSTDLFEEVSFNPLGHTMEPKTFSDNDTMEREVSIIDNDTKPEWGKVNFGSLDSTKNLTTDINGVMGQTIGGSEVMTDMSANATAESKVAPLPKGVTVHTLPGVQPDGKNLNSFVFEPSGNGSLLAPRSYYLSSVTVKAITNNKGVVTEGKVTKEMIQTNSQDVASSSITVFQVPFGTDHMITDTTGVVTKPSESQQAALAINKTLDKLNKLAKDKAGAAQLGDLLFGSKGLSTEMNNVNTLLNSGRYADAYKQGLTIALGENENGYRDLPGVLIKTELPNQDVYGQFDFIYDSMKNRGGAGVYSPALVTWAQKNADSIIHLLMVNYMLQSQFQGTSGGYATPISMGKWNEHKLPFYKDLSAKGRELKEPFYLYTSINPDVTKDTGKETSLPLIPSKYIQPDLAYIFGLYNSIMTQVWIGANGNNIEGTTSQVWQDLVSEMNKEIKSMKAEGKNLPKDANKVSSTISEYNQNNLVSGLSTARGNKDGTAEVYPNKELIGALRALLSGGDAGNGSAITLYGNEYKVTPIGETKYSKTGEVSYLFRAFSYGGSDMYSRWKTMILAAKDTPIQPAVFSSYWDNTGQAAYIMMPVMLGGTAFPQSLGIMVNDLMKVKDTQESLKVMSYANRYIMAFNFKSSDTSKTKNTTGVVEVTAGKEMGTVLDKTKPIVLTGYAGGESFSIVDYFKVQDAYKANYDAPPITAKTVDNKQAQMPYLNLFKDFFTIPTESALIGTGKGEVKYIKDFNKEGYTSQYLSNKSKSAISKTSPDYSVFFKSAEVAED